MKPKIGVLGLGRMGLNHARILSSSKHVELAGFYDPSVKRETATYSSYSSPQKLIEESDAVIVASPTSSHFESAEMVAASRIPALIEKPLARDPEEALSIVELFSQIGVPGCIGMVERFNPAITRSREIIREGRIGKIEQIVATREGPYSGRINDVGVGLDLAVHDLDLITWLLETRVSNINKVSHSRDGRVEDYFSALGSTGDGVIFSTNANWRSPKKRRELKIYGGNGTLHINLLDMSVTMDVDSSIKVTWPEQVRLDGDTVGDSISLGIEKMEPLEAELDQFTRLITHQEIGNLSTLEQGREIIKLLWD